MQRKMAYGLPPPTPYHHPEWDLEMSPMYLRTVVTFVTWLISKQSFLVRNLFYKDIFVDVLLRGWDGERKLSRRLPNTSTFVQNDPSQCLYYVLPIMRCAFEAHLGVGLAERPNPCRFVGNVHISFPRFREDGRL